MRLELVLDLCLDLVQALAQVMERPPVAGQHSLNRLRAELVDRCQVVAERILVLGVAHRDRGGRTAHDVIGGEQQAARRLVEADQAWRVARAPHHLQVQAAPTELLAVFEQPRRLRPDGAAPGEGAWPAVLWQPVAMEPTLVEGLFAAFGALHSVRQELSAVLENSLRRADVVHVAVGDQQTAHVSIEVVADRGDACAQRVSGPVRSPARRRSRTGRRRRWTRTS